MVRSAILFLSALVFAAPCLSQEKQSKALACDCSSRQVRDSLTEKYIVNGAEKYSYNGINWQLYCDSLIAICPNIAFAYQHKGMPHIKYGNYERAFFYIDKAVEIDPKVWMAYRGFLKCVFTRDYENAITDFEIAQQFNPNNYEMDHTYFFYLGLCYLELRNYPLAEKYLKQDIFLQTNGDTSKIKDAHCNSLLFSGILYYEMNELEKAKGYLLKALAMYKQLPDANFYLAMVYKKEGNDTLKNKYINIAKESKLQGYSLNEDNVSYTYYPHQVTLFEINKETEQ